MNQEGMKRGKMKQERATGENRNWRQGTQADFVAWPRAPTVSIASAGQTFRHSPQPMHLLATMQRGSGAWDRGPGSDPWLLTPDPFGWIALNWQTLTQAWQPVHRGLIMALGRPGARSMKDLVGHFWTQIPQSMHFLKSMTGRFLSIDRAWVGQTLTQRSQAMQPTRQTSVTASPLSGETQARTTSSAFGSEPMGGGFEGWVRRWRSMIQG